MTSTSNTDVDGDGSPLLLWQQTWSAGRGSCMSGVLHGIRVVEIADELAAHAGLELAGLGADVIKVEPPEGSATRRIGPFACGDPESESSLFFWQHNWGKRSIVIDRADPADVDALRALIGSADVLLLSGADESLLADLPGLGREELLARHPGLIIAG